MRRQWATCKVPGHPINEAAFPRSSSTENQFDGRGGIAAQRKAAGGLVGDAGRILRSVVNDIQERAGASATLPRYFRIEHGGRFGNEMIADNDLVEIESPSGSVDGPAVASSMLVEVPQRHLRVLRRGHAEAVNVLV